MGRRHVFTSESVTEGHPDKLCDQVSDAILDAILAGDPQGRVAAETVASTGLILVTGEITAETPYEIPDIVRTTLREIGYTDAAYGLDADTCSVLSAVNEQSPDIAQGVDPSGQGEGAGDQGLMFGYASDETPELMPAPIMYAHKLARRLAEVRKDGTLAYLRPDGKSQVTLSYDDGELDQATAIVLAAQHDDDIEVETLRDDLREHVVAPVIPAELLGPDVDYFINHTGRFVRGGPFADSGLTGRKIIVDTYGGRAPHGGGAFSGKDPTKVDRSASYYTRYAAKNVVAAGLARECTIQVGYSIASRTPVGVYIDTHGTGVVDEDRIADLVAKAFDFSPSSMIDELDLRRPIYRDVAAYGHLGRTDLDVPWEATDRADELQAAVGDKARPPSLD